MNDASHSQKLWFDVTIAPQVQDVSLGIVVAHGIQIGPSPAALQEWSAVHVASVLQNGMAGGEPRREAVRAMIRAGGFKPAGRNKPAQEYLLRTITEAGAIPAILNAVDILNVISLKSGLPISLLAANRIGPHATLRYGLPEEKFVFNKSGQELDIHGLICICATDGPSVTPLGSPIKDSMQGKVTETDQDVVAFIYAPATVVTANELSHWSQQLAEALHQYCQATTEFRTVV